MIKKLRYKIEFFIMKYLTPELYKKIDFYSNSIKCFSIMLGKTNYSDIDNVPRPSTLFMKQYFNSDKLNGCEIGVREGINAQNYLDELNIGNLYLIDVWKSYEGFERIKNTEWNYLKVLNKFANNSKIHILRGFSNIMCIYIPDYYLDFVYIDGNHSYDYVINDLNLYNDKVKKNGLICGHNVMNPEVYKALFYWCKENNYTPLILNPDFIIIKK